MRVQPLPLDERRKQIIVRVADEADVAFIASMAERAAAAHLPPDGTAPKPPPAGADLERRRRFH